ncbi:MAG: DUF4147 domain-containing protein [Candidatus Thermoplasmatota archaeon]
MTQPTHSLRDDILDAYAAALAAVEPAPLVKRAVRQGLLDDWLGNKERPTPIHVLALGKAAPRMAWGLLEAKVPFTGLGIAPVGSQVPKIDGVRWVAGEHPIPGEQSFAAGAAILEWVDALPDDAPVLVLLSGGASSLAEVAAPRVRREDLRALWADWLRQGLGIDEMNAKRSKLSILKGGLLGERLLRITPNLRVWLLADAAPATAPAVVASGPFWLAEQPGRIAHHILASNEDAVAAAGIRLANLGYQVFRHGRRIEADAQSEVAGFLDAFAALPAGPVALVGGGEAPVAVSEGAPPGGRCCHAALLAANQMSERGLDATFAAIATDGNDGSSGAAGAVTDKADANAKAAARFEAASRLNTLGRLVHAGPTGTNANDLWVALRR